VIIENKTMFDDDKNTNWLKKMGYKTNLLIIILIFILFSINNSVIYAQDIKLISDDGNFEVINLKITDRLPQGLKLNDGRILFAGVDNTPKNWRNRESYLIIFNPKDNSFKYGATPKSGIRFSTLSGILLSDGKVLFLGPILRTPYEEFRDEISQIINPILLEQTIKKYPKSKEMSERKYNNYIVNKKIENWNKLTDKEKEDFYLPYITKESDLYKRYQEYSKKYELSMYAQIYNPRNDEFLYTGKFNIRREPYNSIKQVTENGNVVIIGGYSPEESPYNYSTPVESYNIKTGEFTIVNKDKIFKEPLWRYIKTTDNHIEIFYGNKKIYYNTIENKFSEFQQSNLWGKGFLPLKNGKIITFAPSKPYKREIERINSYPYFPKNTEVNVYEYSKTSNSVTDVILYTPTSNESRIIGHLAIPRYEYFNYIELKDGRILIWGGVETEQDYYENNYSNSAEIFDPETGKSKIISKTNVPRLNDNSILLDDGRVLLYGASNTDVVEMYIPNKK